MNKIGVHALTFIGDIENHSIENCLSRVANIGYDVMELPLLNPDALDTNFVSKIYEKFNIEPTVSLGLSFKTDISSEDHILEAGLGFAARIGKQSGRFGDFIGRDSVMRKKDEGLNARMMQFRLSDPEPLLYHNEAVLRDGEIVGYLTSGNYGHHLGGAIGLGYVPCRDGEDAKSQLASSYEIDVAGQKVAAEVSFKPLYDPTSERMKA